jgi:hypothetical protein
MAMAMTRRRFAKIAATVAGALAAGRAEAASTESVYAMVARVDRKRLLTAPRHYLAEPPVTVTAAHSDRSAGGLHDYFSEGDYEWPDPQYLPTVVFKQSLDVLLNG